MKLRSLGKAGRVYGRRTIELILRILASGVKFRTPEADKGHIGGGKPGDCKWGSRSPTTAFRDVPALNPAFSQTQGRVAMVTFSTRFAGLIGTWFPAMSILLGTTVGCGIPHGTYQGDYALGSFNRPIAASPAVFAGGDPGMTPGYDGGARLGMPSPDVADPMASSTSKASWLAPTFSSSGGLFGLRGSGSDRASGIVPTGGAGQRILPNIGARLQSVYDDRKPFIANTNLTPSPTPNGVTFRDQEPTSSITSGSSIVPPGPAKDRPIVSMYDRSKDPARITSVEEGQVVLASYGVKWQRLEQAENGEWLFTCSMGGNPNGTAQRRYEARNADQITAVRAVVEQVRNDK